MMPSDMNPIAGISGEKLKTGLQAGFAFVLLAYMLLDMYQERNLFDRVQADLARQDERFLAIQDRIFKNHDDLMHLVREYKCAQQQSSLANPEIFTPLTAEEIDKRAAPVVMPPVR